MSRPRYLVVRDPTPLATPLPPADPPLRRAPRLLRGAALRILGSATHRASAALRRYPRRRHNRRGQKRVGESRPVEGRRCVRGLQAALKMGMYI